MERKLYYLARRNPNIREEDWPDTWRSHFLYVTQFPMITPNTKLLLYCARVRDAAANDVQKHNYDGVGIISRRASAAARIAFPPDVRAKVDVDERRVFSTLVREFSFPCQETLVEGVEPAGVAVVRFLARKPGSTKEDFLARFDSEHAAVAKRATGRAAGVKRYVQSRPIEDPPPGYPFDGISECWFENAAEATRSLTDPALAPLTADLPAFCDMSQSVTLLAEEVYRFHNP